MTDKKPELDPIAIAAIYSHLIAGFEGNIEKRFSTMSSRMKNFREGVWNFFSIIAFRHMTTPIAIVGTVMFYWFPENKKFGMRSEIRELCVFGIRLARWPVTQTLVEYDLPANPLVEEEPATVEETVNKEEEP